MHTLVKHHHQNSLVYECMVHAFFARAYFTYDGHLFSSSRQTEHVNNAAATIPISQEQIFVVVDRKLTDIALNVVGIFSGIWNLN